MFLYILRRIGLAIPIVLAVIIITFTLGHYAPTDPVRLLIPQDVTPDQATIDRIRHQYGLDKPFLAQLRDYLVNLAHGDFGTSILLNRPVGSALARALPISLQLGLAALVLIIVVGIPLGILTALKQNTWLDYTILFGTITLSTIPPFVLAPMLMILLILKLGLLPSTTGWSGIFSVKAILPIVTLAVGPLLGVVRYTRFSVIEVLGQDYVRTARAKGLPMRSIILRHILPNALTPVITSLGLTVAGLITGSIFLENIFGIPGFGQLAVNSITGNDYQVILGTTIVGAFLVIGSNLLVDILYGLLDPRVRAHE